MMSDLPPEELADLARRIDEAFPPVPGTERWTGMFDAVKREIHQVMAEGQLDFLLPPSWRDRMPPGWPNT